MKQTRTNRVRVAMDQTETNAMRAIAVREKISVSGLMRKAALTDAKDEKSVSIYGEDMINFFLCCDDIGKMTLRICDLARIKTPLLKDQIQSLTKEVENFSRARDYVYHLVEKRRMSIAKILHTHVCNKQVESLTRRPDGDKIPAYWLDVYLTDAEYIQLLDKTTEDKAGEYLVTSVFSKYVIRDYEVVGYQIDDISQMANALRMTVYDAIPDPAAFTPTDQILQTIYTGMWQLTEKMKAVKISNVQKEQRSMVSHIMKENFAMSQQEEKTEPADLKKYLKETFGKMPEKPKRRTVSPWLKYLTPSTAVMKPDPEIHVGAMPPITEDDPQPQED